MVQRPSLSAPRPMTRSPTSGLESPPSARINAHTFGYPNSVHAHFRPGRTGGPQTVPALALVGRVLVAETEPPLRVDGEPGFDDRGVKAGACSGVGVWADRRLLLRLSVRGATVRRRHRRSDVWQPPGDAAARVRRHPAGGDDPQEQGLVRLQDQRGRAARVPRRSRRSRAGAAIRTGGPVADRRERSAPSPSPSASSSTPATRRSSPSRRGSATSRCC